MCACVLVAQSLVAAMNLAIPKIAASALHPSPAQLLWIVDTYVLVFAGLLIPAGALGDRVGRKGVLLTGLGVFAAGALLCAPATSLPVLLRAGPSRARGPRSWSPRPCPYSCTPRRPTAGPGPSPPGARRSVSAGWRAMLAAR
ncbi:hypothetical protein GCM10010513_21750 [Streptomyces glebosus]|nr:hypothetical protein GCM10010513_21750 [Streptomyces glebosus]